MQGSSPLFNNIKFMSIFKKRKEKKKKKFNALLNSLPSLHQHKLTVRHSCSLDSFTVT